MIEGNSSSGSPGPQLGHRGRICILDHDPEVVRDLEEIFRLMGHEILSLPHVIGASNRIREFYPDLLIVEVMMPCLSGAKLISTLHQNLHPLPLIILHSSLEEEALATLARQTGAHDFVVKNGNYLNLVTKANYLISRRRKGER